MPHFLLIKILIFMVLKMAMNVIVVMMRREFRQHIPQLVIRNVLVMKHKYVEVVGVLIFIKVIVKSKVNCMLLF